MAALESEPDDEMRRYILSESEALRLTVAESERRLAALSEISQGPDFPGVIVEIRAGVGGDEAALFAGEIYEMYCRFARSQGWQLEDLAFSPGNRGGMKEVIFAIRGNGVYSKLRFESGGHRVQRVSPTSRDDRMHTSAVTVIVLPEPDDDVEVDIREEDLEWEYMRAGGAGGQHVNKTESAVRVSHVPTGIVVKCQDERSQHSNKARALRILKSRIFERAEQEARRAREAARNSLATSGGWSERIRTYNYPQDRVVDHRIAEQFNLRAILAGELDDLIEALKKADDSSSSN